MATKMKLFLLAVLTTMLFTTGCSSKLTMANYDKLKVGMKFSEVTALLGKPDNCTEAMGTKSCTWGNETRNIKVNFLADQTVLFSGTGIK